MEQYGYVKFHRSIFQWGWFGDTNTFKVFFTMIAKAYWEEKSYNNVTIPRGSFPSSISQLAKVTYLSERNIRTALKHLETTGEVTKTKYPHFTVYTVNNYDKYQGADKGSSVVNYEATDGAKDTVVHKASDKVQERWKDTLDTPPKPVTYKQEQGEFTPPTEKEVWDYCKERKNSVAVVTFMEFYSRNDWYKKDGTLLTDWKAEVRKWEGVTG
jgi:hypothetical protein